MFKIKQALLSLSDKYLLLDFAKFLQKQGVKLIASGGTFNYLQEAGLEVTQVSDITNFPEILDGRVKTMHPKIHGAILARGENDSQILVENDIDPIELVVCNLYPFEETLSNHPDDKELIIENIDIGGPAMIRASAKNFQHCLVVTDPSDYQKIMDNFSNLDIKLRESFASKAFKLTAVYDAAIANYFASQTTNNQLAASTDFFIPSLDNLNLELTRVKDLRYGENPHQLAGLYKLTKDSCDIASIPNGIQLQGKELSFNNIIDADVALSMVGIYAKPVCVIIKHANPCGVAIEENITNAFKLAFSSDPKSAFGGIIAFNRKVDKITAEQIVQNFCEVVIAPEFEHESLEVFKSKKNLILLSVGSNFRGYRDFTHRYQLQPVHGGYLIQNWDVVNIKLGQISYPNNDSPTSEHLNDISFGLKVVKYVKSNAIILVKNGQTIGIGAGQPNRSDSCKIAIENAQKYGFETKGAICIGDAFFPFTDSIDLLAQAGITVVIQPGGSIRDKEVLESAKSHNIIMGITGIRHFKH